MKNLNPKFVVGILFSLAAINLCAQSPEIISFSPTSSCGVSTSKVFINGINFTGTTSVNIGGKAVDSFKINASNSITAFVSSGNTGKVSVTTPNGTSASKTNYTFGIGYTPYIYVANSQDNTVSVINPDNYTIAARINVGNTPLYVVSSLDGTKVYVTNGDSIVSVINTATFDVITNIIAGDGCGKLCISPDGTKLYVANSTSKTVSVINTITDKVTATIQVTDMPQTICITPDGTKVYVGDNFQTNNALSVINTATNTATLIPAGQYYDLCATPDGTGVFASHPDYGGRIDLIKTASNTIGRTSYSDVSPGGLCISPDGTILYVADQYEFNVFGYSLTKAIVPISVQLMGEPISLCTSPDGSKVFVTADVLDGDSVYVIDPTINKVIASISTGQNPIGICIANVPTVCSTAPVVTSFSPVAASFGKTVTIKGSGFTGATSVLFGDSAALSYSVINDSTITAVVGYSDSGSVSVTARDIKASLAGFNYVYLSISNFTPNGACANAGAYVYIYGTGFTNATSVSFGGTMADSFKVRTDKCIEAFVGGGSTGQIEITTPTGSIVSDSVFTMGVGYTAYAYIAVQDTLLFVLNTVYDTVSAKISLSNYGVLIRHLLTNSSGTKLYAYVSGKKEGICVINTATNKVEQWEIIKPSLNILLSPDGTKLYAMGGDSAVYVYDANTFKLLSTILVKKYFVFECIKSDGSNLYIVTGDGSICVINCKTNTLIATLKIPGVDYSWELGTMNLSLDNKFLYVYTSVNGTEIISTSTNTIIATSNYVYGGCISPDGTTIYYVTNQTFETAEYPNSHSVDYDDFFYLGYEGADGMAITPDGQKVYLLNSSNLIDIVPLAADTITTSIIVGKYSSYIQYFLIANIPSTCGTLPVSITNLEAVNKNNSVAINWQTSTELNTANFIIQHSTDGASFIDIGNVKAAGSGGNSYSFTDDKPSNGINYYRLKSVDKDGASSYSKVVSVQFTVNSYHLTVYPNPSKDKVTINGNHISSVQVIDNIGRVVKVVSLKDATNPTLSVSGLPAGVYHLRVQTSDGSVSGVGLIKE